MKNHHTEEDVLAAALKKKGRDSRIETPHIKPSWQRIDPMNVRARYMVSDPTRDDHHDVEARCRKCNFMRGSWPEGGVFPDTVFGPCPMCGHDPMLLPWPMPEPLS